MHEGAACVAWVVETSVPPPQPSCGASATLSIFPPSPLLPSHTCTPVLLSIASSCDFISTTEREASNACTGVGGGEVGGRRGGGWGEAEDPAGCLYHIVTEGDGGPCRQHSEGPRPLGNDAFEVLNSSHSSHTPHTCFMLGGSATSASTRQVSESVRSGEDEPRPEEDDVDGAPVSESEAPAISSSCAQYRGADTLSGRGR